MRWQDICIKNILFIGRLASKTKVKMPRASARGIFIASADTRLAFIPVLLVGAFCEGGKNKEITTDNNKMIYFTGIFQYG